MKNILVIACVLIFSGSLMSQSPGSINEDFKDVMVTELTDNDLGEALFGENFEIKLGEMHEAFRENPKVLVLEIQKNANVAQTFRRYAMTSDATEKRVLEEQLLQLYN